MPKQRQPNSFPWLIGAVLTVMVLLLVPIGLLLVERIADSKWFEASEDQPLTAEVAAVEVPLSTAPVRLQGVRPLHEDGPANAEGSQAAGFVTVASSLSCDPATQVRQAASSSSPVIASATSIEQAAPNNPPLVPPTTAAHVQGAQQAGGLRAVAPPSAAAMARAMREVAFASTAASQRPQQRDVGPLGGTLIEAARRQARQHNERGTSLTGRGAYFSARSEFMQSLQTLTQAIDATCETSASAVALRSGLLALDEAEDLEACAGNVLSEIDLDGLARRHRTPVLHAAEARRQSPLLVQQAYHQYAQQQLCLAAGSEPAAIDALHGLGRVHSILAIQNNCGGIAGAAQKSQAFLEAALAAQPYHVAVANDLAVLLARQGELERACELLQASLALRQQPHVWQNLAVVHERLGQRQLASLARAESTTLALRNPATSAVRDVQQVVHWVDASTFAQTTEPSSDLQTPPGNAQPSRPTSAPTAAVEPRDNSRLDWARLMLWNRWQR